MRTWLRKWLERGQDRFAGLLIVWGFLTTLLWGLPKVGSPLYHAGTVIGFGGFLVAYGFSLYQAIRKFQAGYIELVAPLAFIGWLLLIMPLARCSAEQPAIDLTGLWWVYLGAAYQRGWLDNPIISRIIQSTIKFWIFPFGVIQLWATSRAKKEAKERK